MNRRDHIGVDWANVGKTAFGVVHLAGKTVLSAFGAGAVAQPLEQMEVQAGILPDWAHPGAAPPAGATTVSAPDYVVLQHRDGKTDVLQNVQSVLVTSGQRFAGNGYQPGDKSGKKFSFGYDAPARVDAVAKTGEKVAYADAVKVLFLGGTESGGQHVVGLTAGEFFENFFTGGIPAMYEGIKSQVAPQPSGGGGGSSQRSDKPSWQYQQAQVALQQAQARAAALQASPAAIQIAVPSFNLPTGSIDMSQSVIGDEEIGEMLREIGETIVPEVPDPAIMHEDEGADYVLGCDVLGCDVLGAAPLPKLKRPLPPKRLPVRRPLPRGAAPRSGKSPHKAALTRALTAANRALAAGTHAKARAAQYNPRAHTTLVPYQAFKSGGSTVLGAVSPNPNKSLTPAQQKALQKHSNAITRHAQAAARAKQAAARALAASKAATTAMKKSKPVIDKLLKVVPKTRILGDGIREESALAVELLGTDVLRDQYAGPDLVGNDVLCDQYTGPDLVGDGGGWTEIVGAGVPDVNNPGYLTDGTLDPSPPDPSNPGYLMDGNLDLNYGYGAEGSPDTSGDIPLPARDQPLSQADKQVLWHKVPEDGVVYDGSRGLPSDGFGSYNYFYGSPGQDGYIYREGRWQMRQGDSYHDGSPQAPGYGSEQGLGPLIGNPTAAGDQAWVQNIQWATDDKKWFFQSANAPSWLTTEQDAAITLLNQKTDAANAAAAAALAAQQAQDQAQADEAQAKQDAANALAQSAADTQSQIADQAAAAQQQQLDIQQQQVDQQLAAQQAKMDLQAQQMQLDYLQQHPEQMFVPADDGGGDGGGFAPDEGSDRELEDFSRADRGGEEGSGDFSEEELADLQQREADAQALDQEV